MNLPVSHQVGSKQLIAMLLSLSSLPLASASPFLHPTGRSANTTMVYDWADITPKTELTWTPCFSNYTCALLTVPLDYSSPDVGNTSIAYIKLSSNSTTAPDILINPGGPGGSGVDTILDAGPALRQYIVPEYNIIGFDPRGVGQSGPSLECFPGAPEAKKRVAVTLGWPVNGQDANSLSQEFAKAGAYGDWCSRTHRDGNAKYANTPAVAADMLNYAEKAAVLAGGKAEDAQVWYYGFSYGTAIGATFASLFPELVGRMVLDGVVDSEAYYRGASDKNLNQADEVVESFFTLCLGAGPEKCTFYANSTREMEGRMKAVIEDVRKSPIPVSDPQFVEFPTIVTYETLVYALLSTLYKPIEGFPLLAQALVDLETRNGSLLAANFPPEAYAVDGPGTLIACMDAAGRYNLSSEQKWEEHVEKIAKQSTYVGDAWASRPLLCKDFDILAPATQQLGRTPSANQTSTPILFIGSTVDPVTPIKGAHKMSGLFGGSRVLEQNSVGHTSISSFSSCTMKWIRQYFADGTLPEQGTVCESDSLPFEQEGGIAI